MKGKENQIFLDFQNLETITTEAGLLLLAEISRSLQFCKKRVLRGNVPKAAVPRQMLRDMGYYDFFQLTVPVEAASSKVFLKVVTNRLTDGAIVDQLLQVFEPQLKVHGISRKKLYEALIECMQNVRHHAFPKESILVPTLDKQWWLVGYSDSLTGEICFSFLDLGVGIPRTLVRRWKRAILALGVFMDQSHIILEAMEQHASRLRDVRRGNGLTVLRGMINEAVEGRFRIMSDRAHIKMLRNTAEIDLQDEPVAFPGTLISWMLYPKPNPELYE